MTKRPYNTPYTGENLNRVAFPMGGMGAGMICLEGTGALSHVSLRGRPDIFNEPLIFAALRVKGGSDAPSIARVLEGPVPTWKVFGTPGAGNGLGGKSYGLPRFAEATFEARFPFGTVTLRDAKIPLEMCDHRLEPLHARRRRQLQPARRRAGIPLRQPHRRADRGRLLLPRAQLYGAQYAKRRRPRRTGRLHARAMPKNARSVQRDRRRVTTSRRQLRLVPGRLVRPAHHGLEDHRRGHDARSRPDHRRARPAPAAASTSR